MQTEGRKPIFIMNFSSLDFFKFDYRTPQIAQILVLTFKIFQGSMPPDPLRYFLFFSLAIPGSVMLHGCEDHSVDTADLPTRLYLTVLVRKSAGCMNVRLYFSKCPSPPFSGWTLYQLATETDTAGEVCSVASWKVCSIASWKCAVLLPGSVQYCFLKVYSIAS